VSSFNITVTLEKKLQQSDTNESPLKKDDAINEEDLVIEVKEAHP
jgi:hypothetical protein